MTVFEKKILDVVKKHNGIKATEIAKELGCDKKTVNSALYGGLRLHCEQDSSFKWYVKGDIKKSTKIQKQVDKKLSDLCKYYLNCISIEENNGISAFLSSKFSLDYAELNSLDVDGSQEDVAKLVRRVSASNNLISYVGYPVMVEKFFSKAGEEYYKVAPVFLFGVEIVAGAVNVSKVPSINMEVVKKYTAVSTNEQVYALVDLEKELGLQTQSAEFELDELVLRLQSLRSWQWNEALDPDKLNDTCNIQDIVEEGIYNKAVFIVHERSPYTIGLETELAQLMQMDVDSYKNTALYDWIHGDGSQNKNLTNDTTLLEVLPMNTEQRQAVQMAMSEKLTVVTGPPGTGKSQVVTNILANIAWSGQNALFTSKNNKAVDVVEKRLNGLGERPIMVRLGGDALHLAEMVEDLMLTSATNCDKNDYNEKYRIYERKTIEIQAIEKGIKECVAARNEVDRLEQQVCELRDKWGEQFNKVTIKEAVECREALMRYTSVYNDWYNKKNSFFGRMLWMFIGKQKTEKVRCELKALNRKLSKYMSYAVDDNAFENYDNNKRICDAYHNIITQIRMIGTYRNALDQILSKPSIETLEYNLYQSKEALAEIALSLWQKWLLVRKSEFGEATHSELLEFSAAIKLAGPEAVTSTQVKRVGTALANLLPCWAVTSLSAKGRVPFTPGFFDVVIIDEASQCDIASVLPMLYRAKRAVVIGDIKQLRHISSVSKRQDYSLLQKYGVDLRWSYTAISLYECGSGIAIPENIVALRDHHRSCGEIIEFSNAEFYKGSLRVATNYNKLRCPHNTKPGIRWVPVSGKTVRPTTGSAYNEAEISAIVEQLKRLVIDNDYNGTIGIVTPFKAQAERIRRSVEGCSELQNQLAKCDLLIDTVHKFQGDERDIMIFSPVISNGAAQSTIGFLNSQGNLFNVAITRARAVLLVVGDMKYCATCGVSYLEHFVDYVSKITHQQEKEENFESRNIASREYPAVANPEQVSDWEKQLYTALYDNGVKTIPQYPVDKYKLDLAIINGEKKLDIEVDGEMYHKDWNGELCYRDQMRNQRMYELGWDVKRFWVYQIRDDLDNCVAQIKEWVNQK